MSSSCCRQTSASHWLLLVGTALDGTGLNLLDGQCPSFGCDSVDCAECLNDGKLRPN